LMHWTCLEGFASSSLEEIGQNIDLMLIQT
jgi:hypothetical protein